MMLVFVCCPLAMGRERLALEARAKDGRVGVRDISDKQKRTFVLFILSHSRH
jgi:hypothetical protein